MKIKITQSVVDRQQHTTSGTRWLHDVELRGFCLAVGMGVKTFYAATEHRGRSLRRKVGRSDVMTAAEARNEARSMLADMRRGIDPKRPVGETLGDAFKTYLARKRLKASTIDSTGTRSSVTSRIGNVAPSPTSHVPTAITGTGRSGDVRPTSPIEHSGSFRRSSMTLAGAVSLMPTRATRWRGIPRAAARRGRATNCRMVGRDRAVGAAASRGDARDPVPGLSPHGGLPAPTHRPRPRRRDGAAARSQARPGHRVAARTSERRDLARGARGRRAGARRLPVRVPVARARQARCRTQRRDGPEQLPRPQTRMAFYSG